MKSLNAKRQKICAAGILGLFLVPFVLSGSFLVVCDELEQADAIVVIGGDHKPERMQRAVELYHQGYAPIVIISAGTIILEGDELMPEARLMQRQALALGLDREAIILEDRSLSTVENARYTREICHARGITSILLVTSAHHSRRAKRIFKDMMGGQIEISVQPALYGSTDSSWWFSRDRIAVAFYEYRGWIGYWWQRVTGEMAP